MGAARHPTYADYRSAFAGRQMPFAYVDLDLLDENIRQIAARAGGKTVRVASKSVRSLPLLKRILDASEAMQGVMCFTAPEAVYLSQQGLDDLLIGYPCWHAGQVAAICAEVRAGKTIICMIDSIAHVEHLQAIAAREGVTLPVCLDIDMSVDFPGLHFGVWRSAVVTAADALAVADAVGRADHLRLDGVMGYEAQIAGVADRTPGQTLKNMAIRFLKRRSLGTIVDRRAAIVAALRECGFQLRVVNGGGTGSMETTRREDAVTEITAGSGFYSPGLFDHYRAFRHLPAAGFAVEIVRQPRPDIYTCHGGGYIASGAPAPDRLPVPYLPAGATLTAREGAGEVQTPVKYTGSERLNLGDPIFMRHSKAGELCERFNSLLLLSGGHVVDEVPTYRGDGHSFL
jgi:D-serine deaminase-like pyridoxal phosphate-dependent protein